MPSPVDSEYKVPEHPKAIVERYRKIREHARRSEGQEKLTAKALLGKMRAEYVGIREQVRKLDQAEAIAKANEHVARAAAAKAAAMQAGDTVPSAADQVAYWAGFIEETIAYIADHPNEPAPSAVAFAETMDLGPEGRIFTSIKRMGVRAVATWADGQIAERVRDLRAMQRDLDRGRLPAAVQRVVDKATGAKGKRRPKAKRKAAPPSRKRKKSMTVALLKKIEDECDVSVAESEDKDTGEELYEFELVVPKKLWSKLCENPEVLVGYMNGLADEDAEDPEDEPSDSGLGLDPDDPFPNDDDEPELPDEDEEDEDDE